MICFRAARAFDWPAHRDKTSAARSTASLLREPIPKVYCQVFWLRLKKSKGYRPCDDWIVLPRILLIVVVFLAGAKVFTQMAPGEEFVNFVSANEKFGIHLLQETHSCTERQNVVVSPLPVSLSFALLHEASGDNATENEIESAFGWTGAEDLRPPSRILAIRFQHPLPRPARVVGPHDNALTMKLLNEESAEELWISTTFSCRGKDTIAKSFADMGKSDFGSEFRTLPLRDSQESVVSQAQDSQCQSPTAAIRNIDFWLVSCTHLRTSWADNTFSMGKKKDDDFISATGQTERVPMLVSELNSYWHGKTADFESIELICRTAYLQIVLPNEQKDIQKLEVGLAEDDSSLLSTLRPEIGDVEIPKFSFQFEADIRQSLERMGVKRVFEDTDSLASLVDGPPGAELRGVSQKAQIALDDQGISADAGTVTTGMYGGVMGGPMKPPFHMIVNRPFLFFIRDNVTNSLLFAGAVMNLAAH